MSERAFALAGFLATLLAVLALSKIGGTGSDLAIMTGLVGILGMLAPGLEPGRVASGKEPQTVTVANSAQEPVPLKTTPQPVPGVYEPARSRP